MNPITILLADDQTIIRDGLRALLETNADMNSIAFAGRTIWALSTANFSR
jgi:DNA-binding NarL/FixJ family response regulator